MSQLEFHGFPHMHLASPFETFGYKTIELEPISFVGNSCFDNLSHCCQEMFSIGNHTCRV